MKKYLLLPMIVLLLTACGGKVATITPDEFEQLKKDMELSEVKDVIGGSLGEGREMGDTGITEYNFEGEDGVSENSDVTLFVKDELLNTIIESGLVTKEEPVEPTEPVEPVEVSPEKQIEEALQDNKHAESVKVNGQFIEAPYSVQVELQGKENLSNGMTAKGMKMAILDTIYAVKGLDAEISNVGISVKYPLVDKLGNSSDEYVIKSDFDKETIDKMNDDKFAIDVENLPDIAVSWWEHPAIQ